MTLISLGLLNRDQELFSVEKRKEDGIFIVSKKPKPQNRKTAPCRHLPTSKCLPPVGMQSEKSYSYAL